MESSLGFGDIGTALPTHWMVFGPESYRPELVGRQISKHEELLSYPLFSALGSDSCQSAGKTEKWSFTKKLKKCESVPI